MAEYSLRQAIILPGDLGMPLHSHHKLVCALVYHGFNNAVGGPGDGLQIVSYDIYGLMMMAVNGGRCSPGEARQQRAFGDID